MPERQETDQNGQESRVVERSQLPVRHDSVHDKLPETEEESCRKAEPDLAREDTGNRSQG